MAIPASVALLDHFVALCDPRQHAKVFYPLSEILLLVLSARLNSNQVFNWLRIVRNAVRGGGVFVGAIGTVRCIACWRAEWVSFDPGDRGGQGRRCRAWLSRSTVLVRQDRGADARPAMDERPGMVEIDLPCGTRLRMNAYVN